MGTVVVLSSEPAVAASTVRVDVLSMVLVVSPASAEVVG